MTHTSEFFIAIGRCISGWQAVENAMFCSVHCLLGCEQKKSAIVFFAIRSPDAKTRLARDLWQSHLGKKQFDAEAKALFKRIDELGDERNGVAHFQVQAEPVKHPVYLSAHVYRMYFNMYDPNFAAQRRSQYQLSDLKSIAEEFRETTDQINALTRRHFSDDAWPKTPSELARKLPQKRSERSRKPANPK